MNDQDAAARTDFLWNTLTRMDGYITSTNSKAGMLLAYETFLLGAFILKADEFLDPIAVDWVRISSIVLITVFGLACVVSLVLTPSVVQPFLKSNSRPGKYHSQIYFGDVSRVANAKKFVELVHGADANSRLDDLAQQVHIVAEAANRKFERLRWSTRAAVFVQCPVLLILLAVELFGN